MTTALEEFLAHINRRISILEAELDRLQQVRSGIVETRTASAPAAQSASGDRKAA